MRLLLHICCGPCAIYPIKKLAGKRFDEVVGFYYNPNIHPPSEYKRRRDALMDTVNGHGYSLQLIIPKYDMEEYFRKIFSGNVKEGLKSSSADRCVSCWELRLGKTADFAKQNGFSAFTTTLLISPYQDHELIKEIGNKIALNNGLEFYYEDFRIGFRESKEEAKNIGLYSQKYCGCVFSELERVKV